MYFNSTSYLFLYDKKSLCCFMTSFEHYMISFSIITMKDIVKPSADTLQLKNGCYKSQEYSTGMEWWNGILE